MNRPIFLLILAYLVISCAIPHRPAAVAVKHFRVAASEAPTRFVTPDGRYRFSVEEDGEGNDHLFVRDLLSGESRRLTEGHGTVSDAILSPDGRLIAYAWVTRGYERATEDRLVELRIVAIAGSRSRVLYPNRDVLLFDGTRLNLRLNPPIRVHQWSPDGKYLAATIYAEDESRLILFSVADASARVLRTQELETLSYLSYFGKMTFSSDGRFVAYDLTQAGSQRDIFVIPTDGGPEVPLVQHQANDLLLDWIPDEDVVLFASDRSGRWDLWIIETFDGRPRGPARIAYPNVAPIASGLGFGPDGSYYYGVSVWENDVYLATIEPAPYRLRNPVKMVSHVGYRTSTQWSRDGRHLVYAWGAGSESDPFILGIRSVETGKERRLPLGELLRHGGHGFDPQWSPDGRFILADSRERGYLQSQCLYRIDVQTGSITPFVQMSSSSDYDRIESPAWSPDGRVIFERRPPQRLLIRDPQSGQEKELYRPVPPAQVHHWPTSNLSVSPDGQRVAFVWSDGMDEKTTALMVLPTAGGELEELVRAQHPATISLPAWSPDSLHLIYARSVAGEKGKFEFWRIPVAGGEPQNVGAKMEARVPYGLSIHPDGKRIAFTAGTERRTEVWVLKPFPPRCKVSRTKITRVR